jgi:hypothetical protein
MRAIARIDLGDSEGIEDLRTALQLSLDLGLPAEDTAITYGNLGEQESIEDLARGRELVVEGLEFARNRGHVHHVVYSRRLLLRYMFHEGNWDALLQEADELLEWDRVRGGTQLEPWVLGDSSLVLVNRGQAGKAIDVIADALPGAREIGDPQTVRPLLAYGALAACVSGDLEKGDALLSEYEERGARGPDDEDAAWVAMAAVAAGGATRVERLLDGWAPWSTSGRAGRAHGLALGAEAAGRLDEAARLFAEAGEGWGAWGSTPLRGYALLGLGRCSEDAAARSEGETIFAELGAVPIGWSPPSVRQQHV